jgi:hypothetical protein
MGVSCQNNAPTALSRRRHQHLLKVRLDGLQRRFGRFGEERDLLPVPEIVVICILRHDVRSEVCLRIEMFSGKPL